MPPLTECDDRCHSLRIRLYIFYGGFLGVLLMLAIVHFVVHFTKSRKAKYEAREYATRKLALIRSLPSFSEPANLEIQGSSPSHESTGESDYSDHGRTSSNSTHSKSSSNASKSGESAGGAKSLQKIDEETLSTIRDALPRRSSSSSTASHARGRSVSDALQEPVIVTVATVSALFQHELHDKQNIRPRSPSADSSNLDISDIVNSPGCSIRLGNQEDELDEMDDGIGVNRSQAKTLDMKTVGGDGMPKRHFNNLRIGEVKREESVSADAIYPAGNGVYGGNRNFR